ncbi:RNase H domain-containing protein [Trichonephila clavipes]|nr:RNase H domain-containing protein [Trichonephila clavipes]
MSFPPPSLERLIDLGHRREDGAVLESVRTSESEAGFFFPFLGGNSGDFQTQRRRGNIHYKRNKLWLVKLDRRSVRFPPIERAVILSDSTSALQAFSNYNENNCLRVQNCRELLGKIKGKIVFQWVPSHCGLWGNERADFLAKKGTGILQNFRRDLTLHSAKLEIKRIFRESFHLTASRVARDKPWSTLLTSPICVLCDTGQDMTAAHLDKCSALNDLNCIVKSDEAYFWLNGYVKKQNCLIWSEANPQVYVETLLHPEKLTVWCALWAGGILLQKR